MQLTQKPINLL